MGNILNSVRSNPENIAMAAKFVSEAIAKDKVVIFSKSYCPYCTMAKEVSRFNFIDKVFICMIQKLFNFDTMNHSYKSDTDSSDENSFSFTGISMNFLNKSINFIYSL